MSFDKMLDLAINDHYTENDQCRRCNQYFTEKEQHDRIGLMWYEDQGSEYCDHCIEQICKETAYFENLGE